MNRRRFLLAATALLVTGKTFSAPDMTSPTNQAEASLQSLAKPYHAIGHFKSDAERVYMFISFDCPYCANTWAGYAQWGRTLPQPFRFVLVPIVGTPKHNAAATAFYVVRQLAPGRLNEFIRLVYAMHSTKTNINATDYIRLLQRMGFTKQQIDSSLAADITQQRLARAILLMRRYRVTMTPTFGVAGRYSTHAGFTNGDYGMLKQLLDGLVSNEIEKR